MLHLPGPDSVDRVMMGLLNAIQDVYLSPAVTIA